MAMRGIIARAWGMKFLEGVALLAIVVPTLFLLQGLADWWFNLSWFARLLLFLVDAAAVGFILFQFMIQPWRNRLTLETAALSVERIIPFRSALVSAVQLAGDEAVSSDPLVKELIARVTRQLKQAHKLPSRVVGSAFLRRLAKWAALSLVVFAGVFVLCWPRSLVLLQRILLSRVALPTWTIVIPITRGQTVPVGADVTLSARADGHIPKSGRILVEYASGEKQEIRVAPTAADPRVFSAVMNNVQQSFRYQFALNDGVGEKFEVAARVPPLMENFAVTQEYPAYTGMGSVQMAAGNLSFLAGSKIKIEGKATQPLKSAAINLEGLGQAVDLKVVAPDKFQGEFTVPAKGLTGISIPLVNSEGVPSVENTVYRVEVVPDKEPAVQLRAPTPESMTVLLASQPKLDFVVKDDFGLSKLTLKYEYTPPTPPGGDPSPSEAREVPLELSGQTAAVQRVYAWDLGRQTPAWAEGATISYWIEAEDNNTATGPGVGRSAKKTFVVVSKDAKKAELLEMLGQKASEIDKISETQKKVNEDLDFSIRKNP